MATSSRNQNQQSLETSTKMNPMLQSSLTTSAQETIKTRIATMRTSKKTTRKEWETSMSMQTNMMKLTKTMKKRRMSKEKRRKKSDCKAILYMFFSS